MDFSISRVIEMFEERFGRSATTALIGVVALALVCVSIKTIVEVAVLPSVAFLQYMFTNKILIVNEFGGSGIIRLTDHALGVDYGHRQADARR